MRTIPAMVWELLLPLALFVAWWVWSVTAGQM